MPEEHVMLIDETQEKPQHQSFSRKPHRWLKKPGLSGRRPKARRDKSIIIVRNKQANSFLSRIFSICHSLSGLYCKTVSVLTLMLLIYLMYQAYQYNPSEVASSQLPSNFSVHSTNHSLTQQIYYAPVPINASSNETALSPCPSTPPNLVGRLNVSTAIVDMNDIEFVLPNVVIGGHYSPEDCVAHDRVAVIIPYRNREKHLATLLANLHPMLMRQNIDYTIFVVEQIGDGSFNRAKLFNVGYFEAIKHNDFDCFIFHDVDLVPEDDRNLYSCPKSPRHMSVAVDKFNYKLPYKTIFGGVCALTKAQFIKVNGFSNQFWGWGGEDDDMYKRIMYQSMKVERYSGDIARYTMLKHGQQPKINRNRFSQLKKTIRTWKSDGLNSCLYKVESIVYKKLFTHVVVDLLHST